METASSHPDCFSRYRLFRRLLDIEFHQLEQNIPKILICIKESERETGTAYEQWKELLLKEAPAPDETLLHSFHTTPYMLKHSLLISVYSFMEFSLKQFGGIITCHLPRFARRVANSEKVHQLYDFLKNEAGLENEEITGYWDKLEIFRDLRNSIIHHNSTIGKNMSSRTYTFIQEHPGIVFEAPRRFRIEDEALITELLQDSKIFLYALMNAYEKKYSGQ